MTPMTPYSAASSTVLIVDDDDDTRLFLRRLLSRIGYIVREARDGEAALAAVGECPPDLVLVDVGMPGIDGFEVCRRLKLRWETRLTPVMLMTGGHGLDGKLRGIAAGADEFLAKPVDEAELTARVASLLRLKRYTDELESADAMMIALAMTVEARDPYTQGHCDRLSAYASAFGRRLHLADEEIKTLHRGAYLHDLGKIAVPDAVLQKTSALTAAEFAVMKDHAVIGERLCSPLRSLASVLPIIRHHHERSDGSGYPDALRDDEIPLLAQIVGIVDVYDAITTTRPYRAARSHQQACDELTDAVERGWHRADLVEEFVASLPHSDRGVMLTLPAASPQTAWSLCE